MGIYMQIPHLILRTFKPKINPLDFSGPIKLGPKLTQTSKVTVIIFFLLNGQKIEI